METGQGVAISGFIVTGTTSKRVGVRALGPSLANFGVSAPLADPIIQLTPRYGSLVMANDNWKNTQQAEITDAGLAPSNDREAALIATLPAGNYTAIVSGKNGGTGVVWQKFTTWIRLPIHDSLTLAPARIVGTGSDVLIGGFITGNKIGATRVAIRAWVLLSQQFGIANPLPDPSLSCATKWRAPGVERQLAERRESSRTDYQLWTRSAEQSGIRDRDQSGARRYTAIVTGKKTRPAGIGFMIEIYDERVVLSAPQIGYRCERHCPILHRGNNTDLDW